MRRSSRSTHEFSARRSSLGVLASLSLVGLAAACGGSDVPVTTPAPTVSSPPAEVEVTTEAAAAPEEESSGLIWVLVRNAQDAEGDAAGDVATLQDTPARIPIEGEGISCQVSGVEREFDAIGAVESRLIVCRAGADVVAFGTTCRPGETQASKTVAMLRAGETRFGLGLQCISELDHAAPPDAPVTWSLGVEVDGSEESSGVGSGGPISLPDNAGFSCRSVIRQPLGERGDGKVHLACSAASGGLDVLAATRCASSGGEHRSAVSNIAVGHGDLSAMMRLSCRSFD